MTDFVYVYTGAAPNDGTGNSIRDSFTILNENFRWFHGNIWPDQSQNELTANITSTYISRFNLVQSGEVQSGSFGNTDGSSTYLGNVFTASNSFQGRLGARGGNAAIVSTLSATGNVTVANLLVNGSATLSSLTISSLNGTVIGNITPSTGAFTTISSTGSATVGGDVILTNANVTNVRYLSRNVSNFISANLLASATISLSLGSVGQFNVVSINTNATLGFSTITTGVERILVVKNRNDGVVRQITLPSAFNNKGNATVLIGANSSAMLQFIPFDTDSANVYVNITNT
jgi:hypothetical protein